MLFGAAGFLVGCLHLCLQHLDLGLCGHHWCFPLGPVELSEALVGGPADLVVLLGLVPVRLVQIGSPEDHSTF